jgi:methoxymalonate biosynthesis acyl carrier protein
VSENNMRIREFISHYIRGYELTDEEDFFALGFVNSMLAMQLVMFIEKEFNITVEDEDLDLSNFNTIHAIDALVSRKTASVA